MKREHFVKVVEEALDLLPQEFRSRIKNVAILVEDFPPNQSPSQTGQQRRLLLGIFQGTRVYGTERTHATEEGSGQADHDPDSLWAQDREAPRCHDLVRSG